MPALCFSLPCIVSFVTFSGPIHHHIRSWSPHHRLILHPHVHTRTSHTYIYVHYITLHITHYPLPSTTRIVSGLPNSHSRRFVARRLRRALTVHLHSTVVLLSFLLLVGSPYLHFALFCCSVLFCICNAFLSHIACAYGEDVIDVDLAAGLDAESSLCTLRVPLRCAGS
ncbi:hypothetical protein DENSPDRAFT_517871 [Dentipellis sp. KUC8613]|nr:hypothetical protein DENSPDRAFT_517871 [Dentipellis sp. KUC8613]